MEELEVVVGSLFGLAGYLTMTQGGCFILSTTSKFVGACLHSLPP